jgi:predicted RNase H-like HicB family nuclease
MFAEYIAYCDKEGKTLQKVEAHLKTIKQEYIDALQKKTEVVETNSAGIIKFHVPITPP